MKKSKNDNSKHILSVIFNGAGILSIVFIILNVIIAYLSCDDEGYFIPCNIGFLMLTPENMFNTTVLGTIAIISIIASSVLRSRK